jgi:hypothetical protein
MSENDELTLFQQRANNFVRYFGQLSTEQDWDEWKTGHAIAVEWLKQLKEAAISLEAADALVERAFQLQIGGSSGAIDMYMGINHWRQWLAVRSASNLGK